MRFRSRHVAASLTDQFCIWLEAVEADGTVQKSAGRQAIVEPVHVHVATKLELVANLVGFFQGLTFRRIMRRFVL